MGRLVLSNSLGEAGADRVMVSLLGLLRCLLTAEAEQSSEPCRCRQCHPRWSGWVWPVWRCRASQSPRWAAFLRGQAEAILACDFLEAVTLSGAHAARNLVMDLQDEGSSIRNLIRDRDGKFCAPFHEALADAGVQVVLTGVRMLKMYAVMERG